jgi:hypothetical protein
MTEILARTVNAQLEAVFQGHDARTAGVPVGNQLEES